MVEKWKYLILAFLLDVLTVSLLSGELLILVTALNHQVVPARVILSIPILIVVFALTYHLFFAKTVVWTSIGEKVVHRVAHGSGKAVVNPYTISRWPLFLSILLTFLIASSVSYAALLIGDLYSVQLAVGRSLVVVGLIAGFLFAGRGNSLGCLLPAMLYGLLAFRVQFYAPPYSIRWILAAFLATMAFVHCLLALVYSKHVREFNL